ncbi:MAG: type II toxin-antitoxin system PemK/MazF family toxin [Deltaproteobacteria bacterium]|nr:type II toxin-antitoxin system PemK/MazF family toxin [Deltaproteobacteria bacterium]
MTRHNRGDVILVPFPFSDQSAAKKRPVIIISSDQMNKALWKSSGKAGIYPDEIIVL